MKSRSFSSKAERGLPGIYPQGQFVEAPDSCAQSPGIRAFIPAGQGRSGAFQAPAGFLLKNEAGKLKTKEKFHEKKCLRCFRLHFYYAISSNESMMHKRFIAILQENEAQPSFWRCTRSMADL